MSIAKRTQLAGLVLLGCMSLAIAAEKLAELSDEFLEYLGSMEGDDATWLDFAADTTSRESDAQQTPQNSIKTGKASVGSSSSSASPPANPTRANTSAVPQTTGKAEQ